MKSREPVAKWKVTLPKHIAARVELRLIDPRTGKPTYGARAQLLTILLSDWLDNENYRNEVLERMTEFEPEPEFEDEYYEGA